MIREINGLTVIKDPGAVRSFLVHQSCVRYVIICTIQGGSSMNPDDLQAIREDIRAIIRGRR